MQAYQLTAHGNPGNYELRQLPSPAPEADEVVVRVAACGLNHLDLWMEKGALPIPIGLPRTPGGEVAGTVAETGSQTSGAWKSGDRVAIQSNLYCGECEFCLRGEESICLRGRLLGVDQDGGMAEYVRVPERALVRVPEGLALEDAAALTLAGSTAMHMLTDRVHVREGDWVLVMGGAGGVGSVAIQIARCLGARVIAAASTSEKRHLAESLGAEATVNHSETAWTRSVRQITEKRGVHVVVENLGGDFLSAAFQCLARGGAIVTCGATTGSQVSFDLWPFFVKQQRLIGSYGRNRRDMEQTLQWAAEGRLKPIIFGRYPLGEAGAAFLAMRRRQVLGKALILPSDSAKPPENRSRKEQT